jgi:hypothetical protein
MAYVYGLSGGLGLAWSDVQAAAQKAASQVQAAVQQATSKPSNNQAVVVKTELAPAAPNVEAQAALAENARLREQLGLPPAGARAFDKIDQVLADNDQLRRLLAQRGGAAAPPESEFPVLPAVGLGLVALFLLKGK